ncbi:unnamed protein product, partial [Porites evermanni]
VVAAGIYLNISASLSCREVSTWILDLHCGFRVLGTGFWIDFWTEPSKLFQPVDIEVADEDFGTLSSLLDNNGIAFTIQIDDVQKLIEEELQPVYVRSGSWHTEYHNLEEIHSKLYEVERKYRSMASVESLGSSYERKDMLAIKIRGRHSSRKPVFFIQCGIHAREWVSPATCMYIIDQMTQRYRTDDSVTQLLDKIDFVILPVLNVDGYSYTWIDPRNRRYRLWRKNRRPHERYGCHGVDLNRNWGYGWGGAGASWRPCDSTFRGSNAFSEVETRNVRRYLERLQQLKGFIDFHAYSQMWFIPWGYTARDTADHNEQMRVARIASEAITRKHGTRFQYGSSAALLYAASGGSEDWTYGQLNVKYSFSVELRDTGRYGFLLPKEQIIPTGEETFEGLKALVKAMYCVLRPDSLRSRPSCENQDMKNENLRLPLIHRFLLFLVFLLDHVNAKNFTGSKTLTISCVALSKGVLARQSWILDSTQWILDPGSSSVEFGFLIPIILTLLRETADKYKRRVRLFSVGTSYEGRHLFAVEIKANQDIAKPLVFINCGIHAREWVSPATCMCVIEQLVSRYPVDDSVREVLDKVDFVILPVLNVDGYVYTWEKDRMWRKNRSRQHGSKCVGVDLNRNWGFHWGGGGASSDPCSEAFHGEEPLSEKEVQSVARFLESQKKRLVGYLDIHSYGQMLLFPWGFTKEQTKDHIEMERVAIAMANAIKSRGGYNTSYIFGQASHILYTESGTTKDYIYGHLNVKYTFSMELRDTGKYGFLLPPRLIEPTAKEAFEGIKAMVENIKFDK